MGGKGSGRRKGSLNKKIVMVGGKPSKICIGPKCNGSDVPVSRFGKNLSYCLKCQVIKKQNDNQSDFIGYKINEIKRNTKKRLGKGRNLEIAPDIRFILEDLATNQKYCYYSGVELTEEINDSNSWTPDRLAFKRGYIDGNIVLCTKLTNRVKGSIEYGIEQLIEEYGREKGLAALKKIVITILEQYK